MTDFRPASIYADDIETLESAGEALFRHHESSDAIRLLAIALRLRGQTGFGKCDVNESGAALEWPPNYFACDDIDESAGLADVVELSGYSRKAICD